MSTETIFVSYSSKDRPFALGLVKELQKLGANVWIDQLGIGLGENWDNAIEEALEKSETLMLILSPTAVASQNVQDEVSIAINTNKKMVPILIKECQLPMRWQRRQYADLANNPDKAINDILKFLGLKEKAAANIKNLLNLIGVAEAPKPATATENQDTGKLQESPTIPSSIDHHEESKIDLLVSEAQIDKAIEMHRKGFKKNWQMLGIIAAITIGSLVTILLTGMITIDPKLLIGLGLGIIVLAVVKTLSDNKKRGRNIELLELSKLNRERLIRIINKLTNDQIEKFNSEFNNHIKI